MSCIFLFLTILKKQEINNGPWQTQGFFFFLEFGNPGQVNKKKKKSLNTKLKDASQGVHNNDSVHSLIHHKL